MDSTHLIPADEVRVARRALSIISGSSTVEPYYAGWLEARRNSYHPVNNPQGCIQLGLAENQLSLDLLGKWFSTNGNILAPEFESVLSFKSISGYPEDNHGQLSFRKIIAEFMSVICGKEAAYDPENVVLTSGATSALEILAFCVADPGDVILVPAPYYPGFDRDILFRSQVDLVPVPSSSEDEFRICDVLLQQSFESAQRNGQRVRAILLSSPSNPLGTTYDEKQLLMILDFVVKNNIHLICDEIFGGCVFSLSTKFTSIADLVDRRLAQCPSLISQVHIVYGLSKVLAVPGFRIGLLYTWNTEILGAAKKLTRFVSVPTPLQRSLIPLLSDKQFVRHYLSESSTRLRERWNLVRQGLQEAKLPFVECTAGFYCWVNIGQLLSVKSKDEELKLWRRLLYEVGVNVTPGSACHSTEYGWFRLCFAVVDDETMGVALERLKLFATGTPKPSRAGELSVTNNFCKMSLSS